MAKKKDTVPNEPDAGVTEETVPDASPAVAEETVRQIVVEPVEPTDEEIIKAMSDSACAIRSGVGTHDRRGVEARARELLAMLRAFQDLYRSR